MWDCAGATPIFVKELLELKNDNNTVGYLGFQYGDA